jgi:hypothetical protein
LFVKCYLWEWFSLLNNRYSRLNFIFPMVTHFTHFEKVTVFSRSAWPKVRGKYWECQWNEKNRSQAFFEIAILWQFIQKNYCDKHISTWIYDLNIQVTPYVFNTLVPQNPLDQKFFETYGRYLHTTRQICSQSQFF